MKKFIITISMVMAFLLGQTAFAHSHCHMQKMIKELKLTADQKKKVSAIRDEFKSSQKTNWDSMKASHDSIMQQIQSEKMDQSQVDATIDKQVQQIGSTMKAKAHMKHQIYLILDSKQRAEFVKMMKAKEEKIKAMFKKCDNDD